MRCFNEMCQLEDGRVFRVEKSTGEATELQRIYVEPGSIVLSPAQQRARKAWIEQQKKDAEKKKYREMAKNALGNFYFILTSNLFPDLAPQAITRMIMLCTFLDYNGRLMLTPKKPMQREDIARILRLTPTPAYYFWKEVGDKYITERDDGLYLLPDAACFRGTIPQGIKGQQLQKVYIKTVRALYNATETRKHKQLGYVFRLLPCINLQYNILCKNPLETSLNMVEPLTVADLCSILGYKVNQAARLIKELRQLKYVFNGKIEYLISYVDNGNSTASSRKIFVNPHVIYNGADYRRVEVLGSFCQV